MGPTVVKRVVTTILWGDNPICAALREASFPVAKCCVAPNGVFEFPGQTEEWDVMLLEDDSCAHEWGGFSGNGQLLWLRHQSSVHLNDQKKWLEGRFPNLEIVKPVGFSHGENHYRTYLKHVATLITSAGRDQDEYERARLAFDAAFLQLDTAERVVQLLYAVAAMLWDVSKPEMRLVAAEAGLHEIAVLSTRVVNEDKTWRCLEGILGDVLASDGELDSDTRKELHGAYREVQKMLVQHVVD